ncbi:MAG: hypothetical protein KF799_03235 [Bdellovibrionales bacterium]|nr:hypothetical protein [Bdellovibrionales bacterium]
MRVFVVGMFVAFVVAGTAYSSSKIVYPLAYADTVSRAFAAGDNKDSSGWSECKEAPGVENGLGVICEGTRSILNDDGQMYHVNYFCEFEFQPKPQGDDFKVTHNLCQ